MWRFLKTNLLFNSPEIEDTPILQWYKPTSSFVVSWRNYDTSHRNSNLQLLKWPRACLEDKGLWEAISTKRQMKRNQCEYWIFFIILLPEPTVDRMWQLLQFQKKTWQQKTRAVLFQSQTFFERPQEATISYNLVMKNARNIIIKWLPNLQLAAQRAILLYWELSPICIF